LVAPSDANSPPIVHSFYFEAIPLPYDMSRSHCCTVFVVFMATMIEWPELSHGQTVELLDALQHPPTQIEVILTHPYAGTLKTVYSRGTTDDVKPEATVYNVFFNYDANSQTKPINIHGMAIGSAAKASAKARDIASGSQASFDKYLPTAKELSAFTLYSELTKALTQNGPFLTDAWGGPDGLHEPIGWRCFTPEKDKTIRIVEVFCDIVHPGKMGPGIHFTPSGPFVINSIVIKEGIFHPVDLH
jgi:hypothetical protein